MNSLTITRTIHPVGQGGFYTEKLVNGNSEVNIVYDCGGNKSSIKGCIDDYIDNIKSKTIDAIFISHFHNDHINGINYLFEKALVKRLIIPQLEDSVLLETYLYNYFVTGNIENTANTLLLNILSERIPDMEVTIIRNDSINNENNTDDININNDNQNFRFESINSSTAFRVGPWLYLPYNPPYEQKKSISFYDYFKQELKLGDFSISKLPSLLKKIAISEIRKIYSEYFERKHNEYSMTLFSGLHPKTDISHIHLFDCNHFNCCNDFDPIIHVPIHACCHNKINCFSRINDGCPHFTALNMLYTGDFDPNKNINADTLMDLMCNYYNKMNLWETIKMIQVPHHGSGKNCNDNLYKNACSGIISVGSVNKYHHPSIKTMNSMMKHGCCPILTTEYEITKQKYRFEIDY